MHTHPRSQLTGQEIVFPEVTMATICQKLLRLDPNLPGELNKLASLLSCRALYPDRLFYLLSAVENPAFILM